MRWFHLPGELLEYVCKRFSKLLRDKRGLYQTGTGPSSTKPILKRISITNYNPPKEPVIVQADTGGYRRSTSCPYRR